MKTTDVSIFHDDVINPKLRPKKTFLTILTPNSRSGVGLTKTRGF